MSDERRPYVRVYYDVLDDPKFASVYPDSRLFGDWVKLLLHADAMYPAPAPIPRSMRAASVSALVSAGLIDMVGDHGYRVHGLVAERERRRARAAIGGRARAAIAQQTVSDSSAIAQLPVSKSLSNRSAITESEQEQEQEASPEQGDADGLVAYANLTGRFPVGNTRRWLEEMAAEFGHRDVERGLAAEHQADRNTRSLLERTQARLRREDYTAERARANRATKAKRSPEEEAAAEARYNEIRRQIADGTYVYKESA